MTSPFNAMLEMQTTYPARKRLRLGTRLPPASSEKTQQEQEEVDEVEIEGQCADNGVLACVSAFHGQRHRLQALRIPPRQAREDDHADHRDHELHAVVLPEEADKRRDQQAHQTHE